MKKKISWITADYFIDVDIPIVPYLLEEFDIDWYILRGYKSKIEIPDCTLCNAKIIQNSYRGKDPRIVFNYKKVFDEIKSNPVDLIYVNYVGYPYFYPLLITMLGTDKVVHAAHNIIPYDGWPDKKGLKVYLNYVFNRLTKFHIFSEFLMNYFNEKYSGKNTFYTPLSLKDYGHSDSVIPSAYNEKVCLLFFGNVKANKRLDLLIKAFKQLPIELKTKAHLTIAGSCENKEEYIALIDNDTDITYKFDRIPDKEVANLFYSHHYLLLPYDNVAQSGPHMIAYNYFLPAIATDIDGFKEHLIDNETGYLFPAGDLEGLKKVLTKVIMLEYTKYWKMKNSLQKFVNEKYSKNVILNKYISFFNIL